MNGTTETSPKPPVRILHLEDSRVDHALVKFALQRSQMSCELTLVESMVDFRHQLENAVFDIVLADYHLPGFTGLDAWETLKELGHDIPFVILSGAIGEVAAVETIHKGVSDYLLKDSMNRLSHVIDRAIEVGESRRAKERADAELAASRKRLAELTEHLQSSIEQERANISREIHDDIGGALASVKLDLAWVGRRTADDEMQRHVDSAMEMLQHALAASQRIMMNLRPPILDQGLVAAVEWLAMGFERRSGVRTVVRRSSDMPGMERDVQLVAYRCVQEALTNVFKHAQATAVEIDLNDGEGVLTVEIKDNGRGLDSQDQKKSRSFGLLGLRERADKVGGWLDVGSSPRGTSVTLSVPLLPSGVAGANSEELGGNNDQCDFV